MAKTSLAAGVRRCQSLAGRDSALGTLGRSGVVDLGVEGVAGSGEGRGVGEWGISSSIWSDSSEHKIRSHHWGLEGVGRKGDGWGLHGITWLLR